MNFTAYIERQKRLIRNRRAGEAARREGLSESEKLLCDLNSLKGLNTAERLQINSQYKKSGAI